MANEISLEVTGMDEWIDGFGELADGPTLEMREAWAAAMDGLYEMSQMTVHVITGRLKRSGHVEVEETGTKLEGSLIYDTNYAALENARGGDHAFIDLAWGMTAELFDEALPQGWVDTVKRWH